MAAGLDGGFVGERSRVRVFRVHALSLMRFKPPSWSAEPTFFTLEGDPVAFCTALWRVHDPDRVTDMLRTFGDLAPGESVEIDITVSRDSLLAQRPLLPTGAVVLDSSPIDSLAVSPIATLTLEGTTLRAETISEQRLAQTIEIVANDFGPLVELVELVEREVTMAEDALTSSPDQRRPAGPKKVPGWERRLRDQALAERTRRWPDEPNPVLDGRTPREVAAGPDRNEVVRLIRQLENSAERSKREGRPAYEVSWIRSELGIDDLLAA